MKIIAKCNSEPTITIRLTKTEFQELYSALAHYHDYLAGCTAPSLARCITTPLMKAFENADKWQ
jgi:hypothetical protein